MGFFEDNFTKKPAEIQRKGLGRWFEILEERYFLLLEVNLLTLLCLTPSIFCFSVSIHMHDLRVWLLGIMLFTISGSSITALNNICIRIILRMPCWVKEDFFGCMKREWVKSAILSFGVSVLCSVLALAMYLVYTVEKGIPVFMFLMFVLYAFLLMGFMIFAYQQLAIVDIPFHAMIRNAFLLIFAGKVKSVICILTALVLAVLFYQQMFWGTIIFLLGAGAIMVMSINLACEDLLHKCIKTEESI